MIAIFGAAALVSAFLLFWVEPFFARLVLPLLGGAPAVWNTCLMFFQTLLLLGYVYAHATSDLPHRLAGLTPRGNIPVWYDVMMLSTYAWTGPSRWHSPCSLLMQEERQR